MKESSTSSKMQLHLKNVTAKVLQTSLHHLRFYVFMVVKICIIIFWIVMLHSLVGGYQYSSETLVTTYKPQGITTQKTTFFSTKYTCAFIM